MAGNRKAQGDMGSAVNAQAFATAHRTSKVLHPTPYAQPLHPKSCPLNSDPYSLHPTP